MIIKRIEIKDFLVFKDVFTLDFCPGVNIFIGENGTGKTTLLRAIHMWAKKTMPNGSSDDAPFVGFLPLLTSEGHQKTRDSIIMESGDIKNCVYIPEKDILEHAKGLLPFIMKKQTSFTQIYEDILVAAQDVPTQKQSDTQRAIGQKIAGIIDGYIEWVPNDGMYYTIKTNGSRIPFIYEASGYKKLGLLGLLLSCGQLEPGTVLLWDEPENSLNPELVPVLVDILIELANSGVQIFIATHDYNFARYFDVRKNKGVSALFFNFSKTEDGNIVCNSAHAYIKIQNNLFERASADLFKAVVADAMGVLNDE